MTEFGWQEAFLATAAWVILGTFTWNITRAIQGRGSEEASNAEWLAFVNMIIIWPIGVIVIIGAAIAAFISFLVDIAMGDRHAS